MTACVCDYGDRASVYRKSEHTARKQHKCHECGAAILPGQRYEYVFAIWDGSPNHVRTCCRCTALRDFVVAHIPCSCWSHGSLLEDMQEEVAYYWTEAPGLLIGYLRRFKAVRAAQGWAHYRAGGWHKTPTRPSAEPNGASRTDEGMTR